MEPKDETMQDRLLSHLPKKPANLADYRREVATLLQKNEKHLLRQKRAANAIFGSSGFLSGALLGVGFDKSNWGVWLGFVAIWLFIVGVFAALTPAINRTRVELLKELKQVQLQVLELQEQLGKR